MIVTGYDVGPGAYGVALAADGAAWTSLVERGELARVGPGGDVSWISLPDAQSRPIVLAPGPDGAIWFSRGDGSWAGSTRPGPSRRCRYPNPTAHPTGCAPARTGRCGTPC